MAMLEENSRDLLTSEKRFFCKFGTDCTARRYVRYIAKINRYRILKYYLFGKNKTLFANR